LARLGFRGNPFFQEPIPPDAKIIKDAFINRDGENEKLKRFIGLQAGRFLLLGRTGEGKSSLLNVAEEFATRNGILPIRIDGSVSNSLERILEMLLHLLQGKLKSLDERKRSELGKAVKELDIEEVGEEEASKIEGSIEAGLGGLIATLKAKVGSGIESRRKVVYRPKVLVRTERIIEEILPSLFTQLRVLIILDNTEKLGEEAFHKVVEAVDLLPRNALCIATANYEEIGQSNMNFCYKVFDSFCQMKAIDEAALAQFVNGRIESFAEGGKRKVNMEPEALASLFERTHGNLRETYRYCYSALESCDVANLSKRISVTRRTIVRAISDVDAPRFAALDETDKLLLAALARTGKATMEVLRKEVSGVEEAGSIATMRRRLDNLRASGLLTKESLKKGRTYVTEYGLPPVLIEAIKVGRLLGLQNG
jgi:DNA polymerase III delta subunit